MSSAQLAISTGFKRQIIDITDAVADYVQEGSGVLTVFVRHTTAAVTTADLDPGTDQDLLDALDQLLPDLHWRHPHNPAHAPDHLLSSIIGPSVIIPFKEGKLLLGTWQRVILIEFDGPRRRNIALHVS
jgi:secondary thiamine-phosphate synthase enzyme